MRFRLVPPVAALASALLVSVGCATTGPHAAGQVGGPAAPAVEPTGPTVDAALAEVARVHGGHGPWAVAGYRMGRFALTQLDLPHQSFDLEVTHRSPRAVQYSCIADGAAAATGASPGKLNLAMVEVPDPAATVTIYARRSNARSIALRVTRGFAERFRDLPRERLGEAGREAMGLRDDEIFEIVDAAEAVGASPARSSRPAPPGVLR